MDPRGEGGHDLTSVTSKSLVVKEAKLTVRIQAIIKKKKKKTIFKSSLKKDDF